MVTLFLEIEMSKQKVTVKDMAAQQTITIVAKVLHGAVMLSRANAETVADAFGGDNDQIRYYRPGGDPLDVEWDF